MWVGREEELAKLARFYEDASTRGGRLVIVSGEPGIGKTTLVEEAARRTDAVVAWGRVWDDADAPALWPWVQALGELAAHEDLHASIARAPAELAPLLGRRAQTRPEDATALFGGVTELLRSASKERTLFVVLDDLHAADASTLRLLSFVARDLHRARVLLVVTTRDIATDARAERLAPLFRDAAHIALGPLTHDERHAWIAAEAPALEKQAGSIVAMSDGNPLFLSELIAVARKDGPLARASTSLGVRGVIDAHLSLVSPTGRELLATASVLGREVRRATLVAIVDDRNAAAEGLDEALGRGLLGELGPNLLRFSHALVREAVLASVPLGRRRAIHLRVAHRMAEQEMDAGTVVHHALSGIANGEDAAFVLAWVGRAMHEASSRSAFEEAAHLAERALAALATDLGPADECDLRLEQGRALILAGKLPLGREACLRAHALALGRQDATRIARATLAYCTDVTDFMLDPHRVPLLRAALEAVPAEDSPLRAQLLARLASALSFGPDMISKESRALARDATAMAERLGDEETLFVTLRYAVGAYSSMEDAPARREACERVIALAERRKQVALVASTLSVRVNEKLVDGDIAGARAAARHARELLDALGLPFYRWRGLLLEGLVATIEGDIATADQRSREALAIAEAHDLDDARTLFVIFRTGLAHVAGVDVAMDGFRPMYEARAKVTPFFQLFQSLLGALEGKHDEVRAALETMPPPEKIPGVAQLGFACARAGLRDLAPRFLAFAEAAEATTTLQFGPGGIVTMGPSALLVGELAALAGEREKAIAAFGRALAFARALESRPWIARAERGLSALAAKAPVAEPRSVGPVPLSLRKTGATWSMRGMGADVALEDGKGVAYLDVLLRDPHRDVHVFELAGIDQESDAGPMLDENARRSYRTRLAELRAELDDAGSLGDRGRVARLEEERGFLEAELARAFGLGGRDRRAGSTAERARINVQRRLKDVMKRIASLDEALGRHLELSVKTGIFCRYSPTWP